jgi:antitoxin component YwqK of YwqJK toxin-antitoxin module
MAATQMREILVFKKELILKSSLQDHLEEHEFLYTHTVFSPSGKTESEIHYDSAGKIVQEYKFSYNEQGRLVEEMMTEEDGFVADHKKYDYEQSRIAREYRYYADGSFDTIAYEYNEKDQVVKKTTIDPDGETENTEEFAYSGDHVSHYVMLDNEGEVVSEIKTEYDDKGNPVEIVEFDRVEGTTLRREISYYPSGNKKEALTWSEDDELIEKVVLSENEAGKVSEVVEENAHRQNKIQFGYDGAGNIILQEEYDRNGNMVSRVNRVFDSGHKLLNSDVFIDGAGRGFSKHYTLRHEYVYFE